MKHGKLKKLKQASFFKFYRQYTPMVLNQVRRVNYWEQVEVDFYCFMSKR